MSEVWCGYCKHFLDGKCWKKNINVDEDNLSDCQIFEPTCIGIIKQIELEKKMNKCGNCQWLVTSEGEPYYCAIKDLYTIKDKQDEGCEDFLEVEQCPKEAKD